MRDTSSLFKNAMIQSLNLKKSTPKSKCRSKPEEDLYALLTKTHKVSEIEVNNRKLLKGKEIDLYMPEINFGIEYNGLHWHSYPFVDLDKARVKHKFKTDTCDELNIDLLHIWEDDWLHNKNLVLNLIDIHINPNKSNKNKCRKYKMELMPNKERSTAYKYFEMYSIQRLNKSIKHQIHKIHIDDNDIAYVQTQGETIVNLAFNNDDISMKSIIDLCKNIDLSNIYIDMSTGLHNKISGKIISKSQPKARSVKSKRRNAYATKGERIWDSGYCTVNIS